MDRIVCEPAICHKLVCIISGNDHAEAPNQMPQTKEDAASADVSCSCNVPVAAAVISMLCECDRYELQDPAHYCWPGMGMAMLYATT